MTKRKTETFTDRLVGFYRRYRVYVWIAALIAAVFLASLLLG